MFQAIGKHAKSQDLRRREGGFPGRAVDHDPGKIGDVRDPAAIDFTFQLNSQAHAPRIPRAAVAPPLQSSCFPEHPMSGLP